MKKPRKKTVDGPKAEVERQSEAPNVVAKVSGARDTAKVRKRSVAVKVAWISFGSAILVALIALIPLLSKETITMPGIGVLRSTKELNSLVTARWVMIDGFLKELEGHPQLDISEKQKVAELRDRIRANHELHAAALKDENVVLAHEHLGVLRLALNEVDSYLTDLRAKHPQLSVSMTSQQSEFWDSGVAKKISYEVEENKSLLQRLKRRLFGE